MGTKSLGKGIGVGIFSILLFGMATTQFAYADVDATDGLGSPDECKSALPDVESVDESSGMSILDVGTDTIIGVCIKTGTGGGDPFPENSDPPITGGDTSHSLVISSSPVTVGDGDVADSCFSIIGIGTNKVTVTDNNASGCRGLSHADFIIERNGGPPGGGPVGGEFLGVDSAALLLAGTQFTAAWLFPALVAAIGIGIVLARKY